MKEVAISKEALKQAYYKRIYAGLVDAAIWVALFFIALDLYGVSRTVVHGTVRSKQYYLPGWSAVIFFLLEVLYPILMEWQLGATLGKLTQGIRVVNYDGRRITLKQSLIRTLLRIVDAFPYILPYAVGIISISGDDRCRRLGDKAAGTIVGLVNEKSTNLRKGSNDWSIPV